MRYIIIVGIALIFCAFGCAAFRGVFGSGALTLFFPIVATITLAAGGFVGRAISIACAAKPRPRRQPHVRSDPPNARSFRQRMDHFLSQPSGESESHGSAMEFWMAEIDLTRTPAKPLWLIRRVLHRIQQLVSGSPRHLDGQQ